MLYNPELCKKKTKGQQYRVLTRVTFPPHHYVVQALLESAVDYWLTKVAKRGKEASYQDKNSLTSSKLLGLGVDRYMYMYLGGDSVSRKSHSGLEEAS